METNRQRRARFYDTIASQARTEEAGSLARERAVLLLWFLRNMVGLGEIDAYDFVCDGDNDMGIDGLFIEPSSGDEPDTLVIFQSKYTENAESRVGDTDVDRLVGAEAHFTNSDTLDSLLSSGIEPSLRRLIKTLGLKAKLRKDPDSIQTRVVLVTSGLLHPNASRKVETVRIARGENFFEVWTVNELGPFAESVRSPARMKTDIRIEVVHGEFLITGEDKARVAILPVTAMDIADWPGIDDRWLFALNVRHQLGSNRVSKGLDRAIATQTDHRDFLAYHNGLTVICDRFFLANGTMTIVAPSVVNGAQSVLAFKRGVKSGSLTPDLRIPVKVVEVSGRPVLEREVSRRSNTQTAVNPRNLMANSGPQLRISREFRSIPGIIYETRPDQGTASSKRVIKNDEAAQLICAVYNERPWLAVKKVSLFKSDNHPHIFPHTISAHHVILADEIKLAIQRQKEKFPAAYRSSWVLTRLVACYLVGQIARQAAGGAPSILDDPETTLGKADIENTLDRWAKIAAAVLGERHESLLVVSEGLEGGHGEGDDFKTGFKNRSTLRELGARAKSSYTTARLLAEGG